MRALGLLVLAGCDMVAEETVVQELRVLSVVAEPPYVDVARGTTLTATVFDPDERDVDVLLWTCTPGPLGCAEAGLEGMEQPWSAASSIQRVLDGTVTWDAPAPPGLAFVEDLSALPPAQVWALACTPGTCPVIEAVRADPEPATSAWQGVLEALSNPFETVAGLPIVDTSAGFRTLSLRRVEDGEPGPTNPTLGLVEPEGGPLEVGSGDRLALRFDVSTAGPTIAYPRASAGGFASEAVEVEGGQVVVTFVAGVPDSDAGALEVGTEVSLWVGLEAEGGGSAMWRGAVSIVP